MFDLHTHDTYIRRGRSAWAWSLSVHVGVVAIVGTMAARSVPRLVELDHTDFSVVEISTTPSLPPVPSLTAPHSQLRQRAADTQRFQVPTRANTPQEARAAIESTPEPSIAAAMPAAFDLPVPQIASVQAPRSFDVVSAAQVRPTELKTTLGSFGAVVKGQNVNAQTQTLTSAGFTQASSSGSQRMGLLGKPAGFGVALAEEADVQAPPIRTTGFGAAERKVSAAPAEDPPPDEAARDSPVKVLWKPVPRYTDEALEQRIEGDVVLLVRFLARGVVETIRVVGSLGHGLDQRAVEAAGRVRFEPAIQNNEPVDLVAQIRIRFELAY